MRDFIENCFLDRLTFVANFKFKKLFETWFASSVDAGEVVSAKHPYRFQFMTVSGLHVMIAEKSSTVPEVRIDFNPTKFKELDELKRLSGFFKHHRVTRADFAVDYSLKLSDFYFTTAHTKKQIRYESASGALETLYLGVGSADSRYRIYNKALEQGLDSSVLLWRIEHQIRFRGHSTFNECFPFLDLKIVNPEFKNHPLKERALLQYLVKNSDGFAELSTVARAKYRRFLKARVNSIFADFNHPKDVCFEFMPDFKRYVSENISPLICGGFNAK